MAVNRSSEWWAKSKMRTKISREVNVLNKRLGRLEVLQAQTGITSPAFTAMSSYLLKQGKAEGGKYRNKPKERFTALPKTATIDDMMKYLNKLKHFSLLETSTVAGAKKAFQRSYKTVTGDVGEMTEENFKYAIELNALLESETNDNMQYEVFGVIADINPVSRPSTKKIQLLVREIKKFSDDNLNELGRSYIPTETLSAIKGYIQTGGSPLTYARQYIKNRLNRTEWLE